MSGSFDRAASARHASLPKKALTIILSLLFALALVPTAAWAQLAPSEQQDAATESVEAISGEEAPSDETAEEAPAEDTEAPLEEDPAVAGDAAVSGDEGVSETEGSVEEAADADAVADETVDGEAADAGALNSVEAVQPADADADSSDEAAISATASVIGRDADGELETWAASASYDLPGGSTAADLTEAMLEAAGLVADYDPNGQYGFSLNTITSPADSRLTLGWDVATGRYWQLFVNGEPSELGASSVNLEQGEEVVWFYSAYEDALPTVEPPLAPESVSATVSVIGRDAAGEVENWAAETSFKLPEGSNAADLTVALFEQTCLVADYSNGDYGFYLETITSPNDPSLTLGWDEVTKRHWQMFVNGEPSGLGASSVVLQPGDEITWCYSADGESLPEEQISVAGWLVGLDGQGHDQTWIPLCGATMPAGTTAAEFTEEMLEQNGVDADIYTPETHGYWMLNAVTSPREADLTLSYNPDTWEYWQFFVNGELSSVGADQYTLEDRDLIIWYYGSDGTMPDFDESDDDVVIVDGIEVDKGASRPDWDAAWPSFGTGSAPEGALTPTGSADDKWTQQMKDEKDYSTYLSDPLIVNGRVYIAVGNQLRVLNATTGEEFSSADLVAPIDSISRMVYADGLVIVPVRGGRLQALTADALTTVWITDELPIIDERGQQQSLGTLTVADGRVHYGTAAVGWSGASYNGYFTCVDLATGEVIWSNANAAAGYYWSGAASVGGKVVVGDDTGTLTVFDAASGDVLSLLDLGASVRSTAIAGTQEGTLIVATSDGVLHKVSVDAKTGATRELSSVKFGSSTTSTPTIVDGKIYIGGSSLEGEPNEWGYVVYGGQLSVIDEATMTVEHAVTSYDGGTKLPGDSKSAPLVSVQSTGTYVYFTCNAEPGGVYCYRVGDAEASMVFLPDEDHQNYSMSSVVCDADGTLYYVNDSGALFAIHGNGNAGPDNGGAGDDGNGSTGGENNNNGNGSTGNNGNGSTGGNANGGGNGLGFQGQGGTGGLGAPAAGSPSGSSKDADDEGEDADKDIRVSAAASKAAKALMQDESASIEDEQAGGLPTWLPVAGLVVGAGGLVVAGVLVSRLMRRG